MAVWMRAWGLRRRRRRRKRAAHEAQVGLRERVGSGVVGGVVVGRPREHVRERLDAGENRGKVEKERALGRVQQVKEHELFVSHRSRGECSRGGDGGGGGGGDGGCVALVKEFLACV